MESRKLFIIILLVATCMLTACANLQFGDKDNTGKDSDTDADNNAGIANPASEFCELNGGKLEIKIQEDSSQIGYCTIGNIVCEEWSLFRGECKEIHICTDDEKGQVACTMEYNPVCGDDKKTYGNGCGACSANVKFWTPGECRDYTISEVLDQNCTADKECVTPADYLIRSSCPYTTKCLDAKCTVVCPTFDGYKYPDVKECGSCPQLISPAPDFCRDGKIVSGGIDDCGCNLAPKCEQ